MRDAGEAFGRLLFFVLLIGGVVWLVIHLSRRNKSRPGQPSPQFNSRWQHAVSVVTADPRYRLGRIDAVTHSDPSRGTRAWVTWYAAHGGPASPPQDVWFQNAFPPIGAWLVTTGSPGSGQSGEPAFHVDRVHEVIS